MLIALAARLRQQQVKAAATVSLSGRGEEITLTMPLLDEQRSKLWSDATRVFLAWRGGTPPYRVKLTSLTTDADLGRAEGVEEPRVRLHWPCPPCRSERSKLTCRIAPGGTRRVPSRLFRHIECRPFQRASAIKIPPDLKRVLAADWLSRQNRREWGFQAYQLAAQDASTFEPARLLRDCLKELQDCYKRYRFDRSRSVSAWTVFSQDFTR